MSELESARTVETRDRLRAKLDILSSYDRVLRAQLQALDQDDLDRFATLAEERELLGEQLTSIAGVPEDSVDVLDPADPFGDVETARLIAEIHLRAGQLKDLDHRVLGALQERRGEVKDEMDRASGPVSDGAVRYMEAESGPGGSDRLDVVL